ncbi:MAG: ABC transporter ATP-binding protein [Opitutales bacterium]
MLSERYVDISDLVKAYPNPFGDEVKVVDGFNLKVPQGDVVSIIGHSGCGKSTVLNMIAGLIPISAGGIIVAGKEIDGPGPDRAVVFQAPCLLPWMTAFGNVMIGVKVSYPHVTKAERTEMVESALSMVGLKDSMNKYPREMSGGMQQRVGIARAIALKPRMLLLDEPLGRLDSLTRMELQDVILRILDKEKITTMIITHDPDEAVYMSDRICMMTNGPHAKVGEVMEIDFERPRDREAIVETDEFYEYRRRLLAFLDECEAEKEERRMLKKAAKKDAGAPVLKAS